MTWIKSILQRPDGRPLEGACVSALLVNRPSWRADGHGQILGEVTAVTDSTGLWRMNLAPYTDFAPELADYIHYRVDESTGNLWWIRVPPVDDPDTELWLRDVIVDPPPTSPTWRPISMLGRLSNVASHADSPQDGDTLIAHGGQWVAGPPAYRLTELTDVDPGGMQLAQPGDPLVYLGGGRWGVIPHP